MSATVHPTRASPAERDVVLRLARGALYVAMFFVPLTAVRAVLGFPISDLGIVLAFGLSFLSLVRRPIRVPLMLAAASGLAVIASALLATYAADPSAQIPIGLRMAFVWILWAVTGLRVLVTRRHIITTGAAFVLGSVLSSAVAFGQFLGVDVRPLFLAEASTVTARFIGLNGHPNGQGGTLAVAATLCFAAILYRVHRAAAVVAAAAVMIGLMMCASISGLISAGIGFLVLTIRAGRVRILFSSATILIVAVYGLQLLKMLFPTLITPFDRFNSAIGIGGESTVDARANTVAYAWQEILGSPFLGVGFNNLAATYNGETATHNMMLLAWFEGGLLMFVAVTIVTVGAIVLGWRRTGDELNEAFFSACMAALFFAQTGPSLYDRFVWLPVVMLIVARGVLKASALRTQPVS